MYIYKCSLFGENNNCLSLIYIHDSCIREHMHILYLHCVYTAPTSHKQTLPIYEFIVKHDPCLEDPFKLAVAIL